MGALVYIYEGARSADKIFWGGQWQRLWSDHGPGTPAAVQDKILTRDQERALMLDLAQSPGHRCRSQLDAVRQWEELWT